MCYNKNKVSDIEGNTAQKDLKENINFVKKNKQELLKQHENKYLLVFEEKFVGAFDSYEKAAQEGVRLFGMDANFLVHHLVEKEPLNFIVESQTGWAIYPGHDYTPKNNSRRVQASRKEDPLNLSERFNRYPSKRDCRNTKGQR